MATRRCIASRVSALSIVAAICASVLLATEQGQACGMSWSEPRSHFEGVDYQGNVMLVERFGEIDAGEGLKFPFFAVFGSNSGNNSPYAGYGWTVPLLEAKITQVNENTFKLDQPDGWFRMFWRSKNNPNTLEGQGGWKAEIRGDAITAWADCGSKLVFSKGRLILMQLQERKFDFVYDLSRVVEIKENGAVILKIEQDAIKREVTGFRFSNNRRIGLERAKRPRVQVINNQNLIAGMDQSLSKIFLDGRTICSIAYAVDSNCNPMLNEDNRQIVWSAATKKVIKDRGWTYSVTPGSNEYASAAIGRKGAQGQSEFWHNDSSRGTETIQQKDGARRTISRFTSGALNGRIRKIEEVQGGRSKLIYQAFYDENGKLIREIDNNGCLTEFLMENSEAGTVLRAIKEGKELWSEISNRDGKVVKKTYASGLITETIKENNGNVIIHTKQPSGLDQKVEIFPNRERKVTSNGSGIECYDHENKLIRRIDRDGVVTKFSYDLAAGRIEIKNAFRGERLIFREIARKDKSLHLRAKYSLDGALNLIDDITQGVSIDVDVLPREIVELLLLRDGGL